MRGAKRLAITVLLGTLVGVTAPIVAPSPAHAWSGGSATFSSCGSTIAWTKPAGPQIITLQVWGAQGGGSQGGKGAYVEGSLYVGPDTRSMQVQVGCRASGTGGAWPDAGNGSGTGSGGGGSSSVWIGGQFLIVAGGGGGAGNIYAGGQGTRLCCGNGEGSNVGASGNGGEGGHQAFPGAGGSGPTVAPSCPCGAGGNGLHRDFTNPNPNRAGGHASGGNAGGGGGGWNGGGAGGYGSSYGGGGGGGTSVVNQTYMTDLRNASGVRSGTGLVIIGWGNAQAPATPTLNAPANNVKYANNASPTFSLTTTDAENDNWTGTVTVKQGAATVGTAQTGLTCSGCTGTTMLSSPLSSGSYTWSATATDERGLTSAASASRSFVVNTPPTTPTQNSPAAGHLYHPGDPQTFSVTASDGNGDSYTAYVEVTNTDTAAVSTFTLPSAASGATASGSPPSAFGPGSYSWRARAYDGYDFGAFSGSRSFIVEGPRGNVATDPPNQVRTVGEQAVVTITVTDATTGNPVPASPITVSRSGSNPHEAESFFTNASGVYNYTYTGASPGVDVVQVASGNGGTAQAAVEWLPSGPFEYPSDDCGPAGNVVSGHVGDTYLRVRQQANPTNPNEQWVCVVGQGGGAHHGGRVVVRAATGSVNPDVGVDTDQASAESCLPIGQRLRGGTVAGGNPFFVDVAPNPDGTNGAWVCVRVAGVFLRLRATADGPVVVNFLPDIETPQPYAEHAMPGLWSGTCKTGGGTRLVNVLAGTDKPVALYTWDQPDTGAPKRHVCVVAGPKGGRLSVDTDATPSFSLGNDRDASCPFDLYDDGTVAAYTVNPLAPGLPAGACVTVLGFTQRATVTSTGGDPVAFNADSPLV